MRVKSISFENYKAFAEKQTIELKPITILIGKNSSGKSSIAKLFTLLANSLSGEIEEPLLLKNKGVELGGEFRDLVYGRQPNEMITLSIEFSDRTKIEASIRLKPDSQINLEIDKWKYSDSENTYDLQFIREPNNHSKYQDSKGEQFDCLFKGILPLVKFSNKDRYDSSVFFQQKKVSIDVDYIGPFRILPERQFYLTGQLDFSNTGVAGEHAYAILGVSKQNKTDLHENVGKWYSEYFGGWELRVNTTNHPYVQIILSKNGNDINIVDVGQGMNQALPLVVRANIKKENSIIVLEQPELHLHPVAHGDLMELFAKSAKKNNQTYIIETHSENMILRLRRLIVDNSFSFTNEDVIIYWIDDAEQGQQLREITINNEGELSDWPHGVFEEGLFEILEMQKSLSKKE